MGRSSIWLWFWAGFGAVFVGALIGVQTLDPAPNYNGGPQPHIPLWNFYVLAIPFVIGNPDAVNPEGWLHLAKICLSHLGASLAGGAVCAAVGYGIECIAPDPNRDL